MMASIRRTLADCLSLPNTMGKGPTITTAPPRALNLPRRDRDASTAVMAKARPASMSRVPIETRFWSGNLESSSYSTDLGAISRQL
jgi:hypothetical protein